MLTRQENIGTPEQYYLDSLLPKPALAHSVFDNFAAGVASPVVGMRDLDSTFSQQPEGRAIHDTLKSIQLESQNPNIGWGQASADYLANLIGYGINPISWGFGRIGGLAAEGLTTAAEKATPNAVNVFMRKPLNNLFSEPLSSWIPSEVGEGKTLSSALISKKTLEGFSIGAGIGVPSAIEANFNEDSGHVNWGGVARDSGEMGALGLVIGSVPYAFGMLRGKVNRGIGEPPDRPITQADLDSALEKGDITKDEHQWYADYTALQSKEKPSELATMDDLTKRATAIVNNNRHDANVATHEVPFNILQPGDMDNLQAVVPDQLVSGLPENVNKALSDYIVHNRLDAIRENPAALDGVRGFVDTMNEKLANKGAKQAESDKILDEYLTKGAKENLPFSQKELFKHMRQAGFEASHIKQLPVTIPEDIIKHIKISERIKQFKEKIKQQKPTNIQSLYRGRSDNTFGYKTLKEAGTTEEELMKNDLWLGKGYWYAENEAHAKKYGKVIEKVSGEYKIFDVDKSKDSKLLKMYHDIVDSERIKLLPDETGINKKVDVFRKALQAKGFEGVRRFGVVGKDAHEYEIMFFKKPVSSNKSIPNKQTLRRIEELEAKLPKILTPKEELENIRKTLITDKGLPKNWQHSNAYHRLLDLAHVWHNARTLINRVHMERDYNAQEAYRNIADTIIKIADSDLPRLAKPENVSNYLKARIENNVLKKEPIKFANDKAREASEIPSDADSILNAQEAQVKNSNATDLSKEFELASEKYKEFKSSEGVFKNLISCVMGARNG